MPNAKQQNAAGVVLSQLWINPNPTIVAWTSLWPINGLLPWRVSREGKKIFSQIVKFIEIYLEKFYYYFSKRIPFLASFLYFDVGCSFTSLLNIVFCVFFPLIIEMRGTGYILFFIQTMQCLGKELSSSMILYNVWLQFRIILIFYLFFHLFHRNCYIPLLNLESIYHQWHLGMILWHPFFFV